MNAGMGVGGILVIAVLWFILKPLFVGILRGFAGLFTGKGKQED